MEKKPAMTSTKDLRSFGILVGSIFGLIAVWPVVWRGEPYRLWSLIPGGMLILLALAWPRSLAPIYRLWMAIGEVLGRVNTHLILWALFYGLFTPIAVYMRLRGRDSMRRVWEPEAKSYRVRREPRPPSHMRRQF